MSKGPKISLGSVKPEGARPENSGETHPKTFRLDPNSKDDTCVAFARDPKGLLYAAGAGSSLSQQERGALVLFLPAN